MMQSKLEMECLDVEEVSLFSVSSLFISSPVRISCGCVHTLQLLILAYSLNKIKKMEKTRGCSFLSRFLCTSSSVRMSHWSSWMAGRRSLTTCVLSLRPYQSVLSSMHQLCRHGHMIRQGNFNDSFRVQSEEYCDVSTSLMSSGTLLFLPDC